MKNKANLFTGSMMQYNLVTAFLLLSFVCIAQTNPLQPITGKHPVGFSLQKQTVKVNSNESVVCTVHLWYPLSSPGLKKYTYKDYILLHPDSTEESTINQVRQTIQYFFGNATNKAWNELLNRKTFAYKNSAVTKKRVPLIIGMLRPFSTTNTCELLASHGYVVAMIGQVDDFSPDDSVSWNKQMQTELAVYNAVIKKLAEDTIIDSTRVGLLGFSGSGFSQFLYAMQSPKPKCIILLESGLYADGLFEALNRTGFYKPQNLTIPFLYFHNGYTDAKNTYRNEFEKIPGNKKIKVLYMDSAMHHWDYASEGFISSAYLSNRKPEVAARQLKNYLNANAWAIDFFNEHLKMVKSKLKDKVAAGSKVIKRF